MIIAQMVGRNEADRYLSTVLTEIQKHVDMVVFTDDNSDDNTPDVAHAHGAIVYDGGPVRWEENEGAFRQHAWRNLENHAAEGDWIIVVDCDEILFGGQYLPALTKQNDYDVLGITFFHMWDEHHYRVDGAWGPTVSSRMFRYYPGGRYNLRALACGAEPTYVQDLIRNHRFLINTPLKMQHLGYMKREDHQMKYERYMRLDSGNYHSLKHLESILEENPQLVKWENE